MNPKVKTGIAALFAACLLIPSFAEENPADETTEEIETGEKKQTITIVQNGAQKDMVSKTYVLEHTKAVDLAPFVKSAAIRFDGNSSVTCMEDKANSRQLLIVSTTVPMMPYIDEMVEALDRPGKMNDYDTIISGTGIAYGTYKPQYRSAESMLEVIEETGISSGPLDSTVRLDPKTGMFYFKEDAERMAKETGYTFVEDAGRGYRRVVPSPIPVKIVELPVVEQLLSAHNIVITVGGGGIPVMEKGPGDYEGVAAVIDKDRASAKLALDLKADMLVILTAVDKVSINFNKPNQFDLSRMTIPQAREYIRQGHFAPGSMLPKVESCISFVENTDGGRALITSLEKAREALQGKTGTMLVKD